MNRIFLSSTANLMSSHVIFAYDIQVMFKFNDLEPFYCWNKGIYVHASFFFLSNITEFFSIAIVGVWPRGREEID